MSATLSSTEQKVYNKVMASKKKAMTLAQIESAIPGLSKKEMNSSINNILRLKLFTASKNKDDTLIFHAVAVEDAKKQNTLTDEQQLVLSIIEKAGNKGVSKLGIANQIGAEVMPRPQVFKALDTLEKGQLVKTFKSVNAPTMPLYILSHLKPPEDIAGGIWFDESKEYDSVFVDSLRMVVLQFVTHKTFPSTKGRSDAISKLCPNPINPVSKTPGLPTPQDVLKHIQNNKVTSAPLTVKNVMEIARALELDGLIEAIKPVGGVAVDPIYGSDSDDEPTSKKQKSRLLGSDDDMDPDERDRRERKEREKVKAKLKEKKREQRRRERAREKEKAKRKKEKERKKRKKEKERKRKERDKKKRAKSKSKKAADSDDDSDTLRELDEVVSSKSKRKRRVVSSDNSDSDSDPATTDSDLSDSDSDSDTDSDASSDSDDVSSIASDDIDDANVAFKPKSSNAVLGGGISANPFFSANGRSTLVDLSDQAVVYRATRRLAIPLGPTQAPCGTCPQFNFCEEDGPVNPSACSYFTDWLSGTAGGWTADVKAEKAEKAEREEKARRRAQAEANGESLVEDVEAAAEDMDEDIIDEDEAMEGVEGDMAW